MQELDKLLHDRWMEVSLTERILASAGLYEAEKAIIESLAPSDFSDEDTRQFVFYHMHGVEMPKGARRKS